MKEKKLKFSEKVTKILNAMEKSNKKLISAFAVDVLQFNNTNGARVLRTQLYSRKYKVPNRSRIDDWKDVLRIDMDSIHDDCNIIKISLCKACNGQIQNKQSLFFEYSMKAGFVEDKNTEKFYTFCYNEKLDKIGNIKEKTSKQAQHPTLQPTKEKT